MPIECLTRTDWLYPVGTEYRYGDYIGVQTYHSYHIGEYNNLIVIFLRELKPSVAGDGVSQFFLQSCSLLIVGKLQEIEAGGGCRKSVDWVFLSESEKSSQYRPDGVSIIFILSNLNTSAQNKC